MSSKNSLKNIKTSGKGGILAAAAEFSAEQAVQRPRGSVGRPAKDAADKASYGVRLMFTEAETESLKAKSGLVPLATYIKFRLTAETDIFD